jgi:ABC-type sugar transport system ATPase subunit
MIKFYPESGSFDARGATKPFDAVRPLMFVNISIAPGEVPVIFGLNAAGKSSVIGMVPRVHTPDDATVRWNGGLVISSNPVAARSKH